MSVLTLRVSNKDKGMKRAEDCGASRGGGPLVCALSGLRNISALAHIPIRDPALLVGVVFPGF